MDLPTPPSAATICPCRLIIDQPASGSWNMALDEALLESGSTDGPWTLRIYSWQEPTLSLGYFQQYGAREQHVASSRAAIVRRSTGGGAILHDRELTYSLIAPLPDSGRGHVEWLYQAVHKTFVDTFTELGLTSRLQAEHAPAASEEPFLCFQRRTRGDVLGLDSDKTMWHKIAGSAQRRKRDMLLQHGSILLQASPAAPELPGACDLGLDKLTSDQFMTAWQPRLIQELHLEIFAASPTAAELSRAKEIERAKFAATAWNQRR